MHHSLEDLLAVADADGFDYDCLTIARATEYERVRADLLAAYPRVPVLDIQQQGPCMTLS